MSYRPSLRGPPIGGQDRNGASYRCSAPYTLSRFAGLPLKGKRGIWREKQASHILHVPFRCFPLWWLAPPPFPRKRGHYKAPLCCELLMKGLLFRALFCPRLRGKSGAAGKGEASAASQSAECQSSPMTLKVNPVTLTLCSSPVRAIPQPSARRAVKLKNLPAHRAGPS